MNDETEQTGSDAPSIVISVAGLLSVLADSLGMRGVTASVIEVMRLVSALLNQGEAAASELAEIRADLELRVQEKRDFTTEEVVAIRERRQALTDRAAAVDLSDD